MSLSLKYIPLKAPKSFRSEYLSSMIGELRDAFPDMRIVSSDLDSINGKRMDIRWPTFWAEVRVLVEKHGEIMLETGC